eukprot:CAMPEP_0185025404 /NCGR_PEP_ID=MMETSP1103-20130426/8377_1 /TAXON_ID=36769 /ORGANISM="Paraphysomonas bandaiensis, Strain Caron Lab Isolate" /LENGTH=704 /DNA_ID=CAMNT_0027558601 /DNA_START=198 /DNA_END=2312 /DNA_ORIENTATION=-
MANIHIKISDISLSGRIIAHFPENLTEKQRQVDALSQLGELTRQSGTNIIKLPNISASIPQLISAIYELREKGYDIPLYPQNPMNDEEKLIKARYAEVLGSAVNPVLRQGNSDRRVAAPVKEYAQRNPHKMMSWSPDCRARVAHMTEGDFYSSERSVRMTEACNVRIEHVDESGSITVLRQSVPVQAGEVLDASTMQVQALKAFFANEINRAKEEGMLLSLHLKATMMKVSDPIIFGHCVREFFKPVFDKHVDVFSSIGINPNNGVADMLDKIKSLPDEKRREIERDIDQCYECRPDLAMVNSDKGITNLHVPSDVIIDASMPVVVRDGGQMWNKHDKLQETICMIPDRCYATMYQEIISFCKERGQFDVSRMGSVSNVGLMANKAEEYGSHDKTFEISSDGVVRIVDSETGVIYCEHSVHTGDIYRACQTKDVAIRDWVRLAVSRARATGDRVIFWLDQSRAHDSILIGLVNEYLNDHDTSGLDIGIAPPYEAMRISCERASNGLNTISATGNVLRDYLTDLFPILELGTSSKMLSIVPLLSGGGLFETGAGGSAPKHVQQFVEEGHLRWDSLGEYLALAASLDHLAQSSGNSRAKQLSDTLNKAIGRLLENRKSPSRKVNQLDNRGCTFYLTLYWARYMAEVDPSFQGLYRQLSDSRSIIVSELNGCQGKPVDIGGYYKMDHNKVSTAMRPSATLNGIIDSE